MRNLLLLFSILILIGCSGTEEKEVTRKTVLIEKAKEDARERLKSPSTAEFIDSTATVLQLKGENGPSSSYRINISVDAQNSFGATSRERYMLIYQDKGGDSLSSDNYELTSFN